jgi:hypothetical protein
MEAMLPIESIRRLVLATLAELGMPDANWSLVKETVLRRDRSHTGRRFAYAGVRAVWFPEANVVDFFAEDGTFLKTVPLAGPQPTQQAAA